MCQNKNKTNLIYHNYVVLKAFIVQLNIIFIDKKSTQEIKV